MTTTESVDDTAVESVDEFRARARAWLPDNLPRRVPGEKLNDARDHISGWDRAKELQKKLHAGGFAGICFPKEYGGLGLPYAYQRAFDEETLGYEMPLILNTPTFSICGAAILDTGSEQQKIDRLGGIIRGEEALAQLLSEPRGGSDLAGVITKAVRDGDEWILNGAKTWSTSAFAADYGLCLARTNWDVPKHEGLTMFLVPINSPGITIRRITQINGSTEFCEEYFDDVRLAGDSVVGEVNDGWAVASRLLHHERRAVGNGSEFTSGVMEEGSELAPVNLVGLARANGKADDPRVRQIIGRAMVRRIVGDQMVDHVTDSVESGALPPTAGSLMRIFHAEVANVDVDAAIEVAGSGAVVGDEAQVGIAGIRYLSRQAVSLGGGTIEISRNIISERVLNMPREYAADRGVPFKDVKQDR